MKSNLRLATGAAFLLSALTFLTLSLPTSHPTVPAKNAVAPKANFAQLPLSFEANEGQTDSQVRYLARGAGYTIFLTEKDAVIKLQDRQGDGAVRRFKVAGASEHAPIDARDQLTGKSNYFIGNDPTKWRTNIPMFSQVRYAGVYPGVDLVYHGNQRQLEYDFVVAPGAHPRAITLNCEGADKIDINRDGDLVLRVAEKEVLFRKPLVYQEINGARHEVAARYVLKDKLSAGFEVAQYDTTKPLVIDPVLAYSTYLGGTGNETAQAIAVDATGSAYAAGYTNSLDFPVTAGAYQTTFASNNGLGNPDGYIAKLNPAGNTIVYATYLGGTCTDIIYGIAVDAAGEAYVTGQSGSGINPQSGMPDCGPFSGPFIAFPQMNPFQAYAGTGDAFITKLNAAGNGLIFSSFLGGTGSEFGRAIAVDPFGNAYATGETISGNFPTTPLAYQTLNNGGEDAYVTKVSPVGTLLYSTYLGGGDLDSGRGITADALGNAYITGVTASGSINACGNVENPPAFPTTAGAYQTSIAPSQCSPCGLCCTPNNIQCIPNLMDAFVTKMNSTGTALVYSTYLGGGIDAIPFGSSAVDEGHAIAVDSSGNAYVTGRTTASNFPTLNAVQPTYGGGSQPEGDAFVTKLNASGSALVFSTYLGGASYDEGNGIAVDAAGEAFVAGTGGGNGFPAVDQIPPPGPTPPPIPGFTPAPPYGGFVTKFSASVNPLIYSTGIFATTTGKSVAIDPLANAYITGDTQGGIQTVNPAQPTYAGGGDAYVIKLGPACVTPPANMISWWQGENNTIDIISGNNGTWIGTPTYATGEVNTAFSFDGTSQYIDVGNPPSHQLTNQVTIDGWIYPTANKNDVVYFGKTAYGDNEYVLIFQFNELTGMIQEGIVGSAFVPPLNQWSHIALTYDGTIAKLYANGVVVGTLVTSVTMHTAQKFFIGGRDLDPFGRHFLFPGLIDEVEVFGRALTDVEIAAIFAAGSAGKCVPQATPTPTPTPTPNLCANVTCTASDQCHDVGTCDPQSGMCSNPQKANGSACNDGDACTQSDTCQSGTCVGSNPVTCTASDQCHDAGTCDPSTGTCSNPQKANGTSCNDGNACTQTDSCQSGTCVGSNPVTCTAS